jgi:DNA invertase Pin-like site-specific DNA recombinase
MRIVTYCRVSTSAQADSGLGLEAQRTKIGQYAALYDVDVVAAFEDAGQSGKDIDGRPGLQSALAMLDDGSADGLLVAKLDRLTRSVRDLDTLIADYFGDGKFHLLSVDEQLDTSTATGRLVMGIIMQVSQWERSVIAERTKAALRAKKARGECVGTVPFGFRREGDQLVREPQEQDVIAIIQTFRPGQSWRWIAAWLNDTQAPAKNGGKWHPESVRRVYNAAQKP